LYFISITSILKKRYKLFLLKEILESIKRHKSKSFIAGITVAWGLIMLILLVGTGQGLQRGVKKLFSDYTIKAIEVYGGEASMSGVSESKGDMLTFNNQDIYAISKTFKALENISPILPLKVKTITSYAKETKRFSIFGVNKNYFKIKTLKLKEGRFFDLYDSDKKVIVIGKKIAEDLFNNTRCLGQIIFINNIGYTIIGILAKGNLFSDYSNSIYMPFNEASNYMNATSFDEFILSLSSQSNITEFKKMLKVYLSNKKGFNIHDKQVIIFNSVEEELKTFNKLFKSINVFLWFISISFLVSGMLGIFNMMTVLVKDRIGEIGIRKAIGATPESIQKMVLFEAVFITLFSGILGLIIGYLIIVLANLYILASSESAPFLTLYVNLPIILGALILLVISGSIAGIIPARKASNILPVEALRELNN